MSIRSSKKFKGDVSLSDPIGMDKEGNELSLLDIMSADITPVNEIVEMRLQVEVLRELIDSSLSPREKLVLELRSGLKNGHCLPQREVAQILEISRSYVSRIGYCKGGKALEMGEASLSRHTAPGFSASIAVMQDFLDNPALLR